MAKRYGWLLLILLAASSLRLFGLTDVPPGLTHDEADHGLDAWGVVTGVRPIYFTVGYGREPFFDYATAGLMSFLGPTYLAGRLTAVYLSLILIAGTYAWASHAFGHKSALLTAAGLAVGFWAVMTGRQALRSIALPTLFVLAVYFYWRALEKSGGEDPGNKVAARWPLSHLQRPIVFSLVAGLFLGLTFYTYIPARLLWLVFPIMLLFLALFDRSRFKCVWPGTALMLLIAAGIAAPLFLFLSQNPSAEVRVAELSPPLQAMAEGNLGPLLENISDGLLLLTFQGDSQWRYNIPGRAFLSPLLAILFFLGLGIGTWRVIAGIRDRQRVKIAAAPFFALVWLVLGLSPALVTGPDLSTTRIIGLQPVLYLFPALALSAALESRVTPKRLTTFLTVVFFVIVAVQTARDYFLIWANAPEVRVQYETALVETIDYLNQLGHGPAAISTTTPNRFHSPAVAQLTLDNPDVALRWFDGQHSLLIPQNRDSTIVFSKFAALSPFLQPYFEADLVDELPLRATDLNKPLGIYSADAQSLINRWQLQFDSLIQAPPGAKVPVQFGQAAAFLGYDLQTPAVSAGDTMRLVTFWRVQQPLDEAVIFIHIEGPDGRPLAQSDRLDAPSSSWVAGDVFLQLHEIKLPDSVLPGDYPLLVGLYTRQDLRRLPVLVDGAIAGDYLRLPPLTITP